MSAFPTADDIACAIVAACRQTGEAAFDVASGVHAIRARRYAFKVLAEAFPVARKAVIAKVLGASSYEAFPQQQG